jgi:hypothetical protein
MPFYRRLGIRTRQCEIYLRLINFVVDCWCEEEGRSGPQVDLYRAEFAVKVNRVSGVCVILLSLRL